MADTPCFICGGAHPAGQACPQDGPNAVDDGQGRPYRPCSSPRCDLTQVRPGVVECSDYCLHDAGVLAS